jgi:hypothetical protein
MRSILFAALVAAGFALVGTSGVNATVANGKVIGQAAQQSDQTIEVREGCGRGRHWSRWQQRCDWS